MADNLQKADEKDLMKLLNEKRVALRGFRFGIAGSKIRNVKEGRSLKKDIARILTEISHRHNQKPAE
ncbi:MAG: 50S ribosomal protein L29 [Candidatus Zambryskibacteria bacterium RIFCSPHIGHO2_01_FULL_43_25]|uniref:Large ribosomal subunit protein uL29 n=1 Tax=Candidatus Zambryskibacteria bacterium RIFCSPLOWO2_01_FULL_45_21 TaxID=1802761 RepID=A0A1G2U689_9BACT|nr:MAG: 50S ribosomal protein L29 [Candidatus Zambryskibacteria bacterium RIFCSPHIGHO2_01_FULL_43_25]OHB00850.1 MAG: 50S ribosomal protein L29 [Candidatus Zambryskibacteria bacterium RIFCSPHIGHO2_12_FULL_44_12b]OHB04422.1 MAG: 50S ribosomal protein L29 [Candidatus Zambryskibacteria bacterium RIFCSPLOWO2_01_FULL_45_21]